MRVGKDIDSIMIVGGLVLSGNTTHGILLPLRMMLIVVGIGISVGTVIVKERAVRAPLIVAVYQEEEGGSKGPCHTKRYQENVGNAIGPVAIIFRRSC